MWSVQELLDFSSLASDAVGLVPVDLGPSRGSARDADGGDTFHLPPVSSAVPLRQDFQPPDGAPLGDDRDIGQLTDDGEILPVFSLPPGVELVPSGPRCGCFRVLVLEEFGGDCKNKLERFVAGGGALFGQAVEELAEADAFNLLDDLAELIEVVRQRRREACGAWASSRGR